MFSSLETIAIIVIIIGQLIIAVHAYRQIDQIKSFLPNGRASLSVREYEIPADQILELELSQVVGHTTYAPSQVEEVETVKEMPSSVAQLRDEKGRFISKRSI